jgi:CRP-like cAMP-binding protein
MASPEDSAPEGDKPELGGSRMQHFQAPVPARAPYRRRNSEASSDRAVDTTLRGGLHGLPTDRPRKSLDELELLQSVASEMTVIDAVRKRGSRGSLVADGSDLKGKRYAEMMERFQIRRVSRSFSGSSSNSHAVGGGGVITTVDAPPDAGEFAAVDKHGSQTNRSTPAPAVPPLASLSARIERVFTDLGSRRDLESAVVTPHESSEHLAKTVLLRTERSSRFSLHWLLVAWRRRVARDLAYVAHNLTTPISPSSTFSRVRLAVLIIACTVHVVLFPLETAFLPEDSVLDTGTTVEVVIEIVLLLDFVLMFNTAFYNKRTKLVTSRRHIARHYLRTWFVPDLLSSVPVDFVLTLSKSRSVETKWFHLAYDVAGRSQRVVHIVRLARFMWTVLLDGSERSVFEWLLYSRYSHLLRIVWIVLLIILVAHYLACGWRLLFITTPMRGSPLEEYVACFYDVLQLLQGQGVPTTTIAQNVYATAAILMGSIALATIFGNVAILVSNFNANATSYQRKMESVFAVMGKLQLPPQLRERIHQYYEHLWREYESLDGEIVAFSKGLSHTLELEVVLFKYMDLIVHVPFWRDASPDFQKQLMLSLHVRVYMPDDFILRRGEVGDEFFVINRGICELALGPDSFECTIDPLLDDPDSPLEESEDDDDPQSFKTVRYELPTVQQQHDRAPLVRPAKRLGRSSAYALDDMASARVTAERRGSSGHVLKLRRGQSFGEIALLMNYERTANVRALTYVEMCVLLRRDFQAILLKHPTDRKHVLTKILTKTMENNDKTNVACPLRATVQSVFGERDTDSISAMHAALLISNAVNLPLDDESIKFGIGVRLREQLVELRDKQRRSSFSAPTPTTTTSARQESPAAEAVTPATQSEGFHTLADQVQQLEHVQTRMSSTMLELAAEVRLLRTANEQLQRMIGVYETRLTELTRTESAVAATSSPVASAPSLRPVPRRLSRRLSQGSIETVQPETIPEEQPRVLPAAIMRSSSVSNLFSSRSISTARDTLTQDDSVHEMSQGQQPNGPVVLRIGRRPSPVARSHSMNNPPGGLSSLTGPRAEGLANANHHGEPARASLNARILMPLRSLFASDAVETASPTMYADQLFRNTNPPEQSPLPGDRS